MTDLIHDAITEDDYIQRWLHGDRIEVIEGEVRVMSPAGIEHHLIIMWLCVELELHLRQHPLGNVMPDGVAFVIEHCPNGTIKHAPVPDVSYVRAERMPADADLARPFNGAPDVAIEVISPGNDADEMLQKVREYLDHGAEEVWLLYPASKELHRYRRSDQSHIEIYRVGDTLDAAPLFPGLSIEIAALFARHTRGK